jgi:hypothetical protein
LAARTRWADLPGDAPVLAEGDTTVDLAAGRGNVEASGYRGVEIDACHAWRIADYALFAALYDALTLIRTAGTGSAMDRSVAVAVNASCPFRPTVPRQVIHEWQSAETLAGKPPLRLQPGNGTLSPHRLQCQLHGGIRLSGGTSASSLDSKF